MAKVGQIPHILLFLNKDGWGHKSTCKLAVYNWLLIFVIEQRHCILIMQTKMPNIGHSLASVIFDVSHWQS